MKDSVEAQLMEIIRDGNDKFLHADFYDSMLLSVTNNIRELSSHIKSVLNFKSLSVIGEKSQPVPCNTLNEDVPLKEYQGEQKVKVDDSSKDKEVENSKDQAFTIMMGKIMEVLKAQQGDGRAFLEDTTMNQSDKNSGTVFDTICSVIQDIELTTLKMEKTMNEAKMPIDKIFKPSKVKKSSENDRKNVNTISYCDSEINKGKEDVFLH